MEANALRPRSKTKVKLGNWFFNEGRIILINVLLVGLTTYLFVSTFVYYASAPEHQVNFKVLGFGVPLAKAAAAVIRLDLAIIFFAVCRTVLTYLRKIPRSISVLPIDSNLNIHANLARSIVFFTIIHCAAHYRNYLILQSVTEHSAFWYAFVSGPGITGQLATYSLFLLVTAAPKRIRRAHHEVFWIAHQMSLFFALSLLPHGAFCFIKPATLLLTPMPANGNSDSAASSAGELQFSRCDYGGKLWRYLGPGMLVYAFERVARELRARMLSRKIKKLIQHPGSVLEIHFRIEQPTRRVPRAGQYVWVNCPSISVLQWHPFTLTSCPYENHLAIHMRVAGDWTAAVAAALVQDRNGNQEEEQQQHEQLGAPRALSSVQLPRIMVDGPFGAASETWMDFETIMCVAAGIGVTPFASILKCIYYARLHSSNAQETPEENESGLFFNGPAFPATGLSPRRASALTARIRVTHVHFYWLVRTPESFEWFRSLLGVIEESLPALVTLRMYLTGGISVDDAARIMMLESSASSTSNGYVHDDAVTGLRAKTQFGRPVWDSEFKRVAKSVPVGSDIGVFFCGPPELAKTLRSKCNMHTGDGVSFYFSKENF